MKILRIDNQGCCNYAVFGCLEDLRQQLCEFHSIDYEGDDEQSIFDWTLDVILDWGDWSYEIISDEEADDILKEIENSYQY